MEDRRVQRTRQLLERALLEFVDKSSFPTKAYPRVVCRGFFFLEDLRKINHPSETQRLR